MPYVDNRVAFTLRIDQELDARIRASKSRHMSMNAWLTEAVKEKLEAESRSIGKEERNG